jgi:hypothetical protein
MDNDLRPLATDYAQRCPSHWPDMRLFPASAGRQDDLGSTLPPRARLALRMFVECVRHDHGGRRPRPRLNRAIHTIALTRQRSCPRTC